jgi:hypothetical protein
MSVSKFMKIRLQVLELFPDRRTDMFVANTRISETLSCDCARNELAAGQIVHAVLPKLIAKQLMDNCKGLLPRHGRQ